MVLNFIGVQYKISLVDTPELNAKDENGSKIIGHGLRANVIFSGQNKENGFNAAKATILVCNATQFKFKTTQG